MSVLLRALQGCLNFCLLHLSTCRMCLCTCSNVCQHGVNFHCQTPTLNPVGLKAEFLLDPPCVPYRVTVPACMTPIPSIANTPPQAVQDLSGILALCPINLQSDQSGVSA